MTEEQREAAREATVQWMLAARAEYLKNGASALKHWDQIQDRMRAAARMSVDVSTWCTSVARGLQLGAPSDARAKATLALKTAVSDPMVWLELVEEEHGYLMALARMQAEERKEKRKAAESERRLEEWSRESSQNNDTDLL